MIRRTPLKRSQKPLKRTSLRKVSNRHAKELRFYRIVRDGYMAQHPNCEMPGCEAEANDLHHKAGRGPNLSNTKTFMAVCRPHHEWIHSHALAARTLGVLV